MAWTGATRVAGVGGLVSGSLAARAAVLATDGSGGNGLAFGVLKSKHEVRSPHTARRQGAILGSITPKRVSRKRITEVWSNTWLST